MNNNSSSGSSGGKGKMSPADDGKDEKGKASSKDKDTKAESQDKKDEDVEPTLVTKDLKCGKGIVGIILIV